MSPTPVRKDGRPTAAAAVRRRPGGTATCGGQRRLWSAASWLLAFGLSLGPAAVAAGHYEAWVVCVRDGDTVVLVDASGRERVLRLLGIDAPERKQPYAQAARLALARWVAGQRVQPILHKRDRYGRLLGSLQVEGEDLGLRLLRQGLAWHDPRHVQDQPAELRTRYIQAEAEARAAGRGLWSLPQPVPPWQWRARR